MCSFNKLNCRFRETRNFVFTPRSHFRNAKNTHLISLNAQKPKRDVFKFFSPLLEPSRKKLCLRTNLSVKSDLPVNQAQVPASTHSSLGRKSKYTGSCLKRVRLYWTTGTTVNILTLVPSYRTSKFCFKISSFSALLDWLDMLKFWENIRNTKAFSNMLLILIVFVKNLALAVWFSSGQDKSWGYSSRWTSGVEFLSLMAHLHWRRRTRVRTWIRMPNPMATLYYAEHVHIAQILTQIPISAQDRNQSRIPYPSASPAM